MTGLVPCDCWLICTKPPAGMFNLLQMMKKEAIALSTSLFYANSTGKLYGESMRKALSGFLIDISAARSYYLVDVGLNVYRYPTYTTYCTKTLTPSRENWEKSVVFHPTKPKANSLLEIYQHMKTSNLCNEVGAIVTWKHLKGVFYTYDATEEKDEMELVQKAAREVAIQFHLPCYRLERTSYSGPWTIQIETRARTCTLQ